MIGYLQGTIKEKSPPKLLLFQSQGTGYELETPLSTFDRLEGNSELVSFYIHLISREDALLLYGFLTLEERELFRLLIKINNVGPKLALSILSHASVNQFIEWITQQDHARLNRIPGLGKKTTERLMMELKDRLIHLSTAETEFHQNPVKTAASPAQEALNALIALGYKPLEAQKLLSNITIPCHTVEEWIRAALKEVRS